MSKKLLDSLLTDIKAGDQATVNNRLATLSDEQLNELFAQVHPNKALGTASSERFVPGSVCNLRGKYLKKLITTAMTKKVSWPPPSPLPEGFNKDLIDGSELAKMHRRRFPKSKAQSYKNMESELSEDDLCEAVPEQSAQERVVIDRFLERLFRFNPDLHRQADGQSFVGDPVHTDVSLLEGTDVAYDNIPPNDTHSRFNSYYEINYEALRVATQQIYNVKPDLEHAKIVYNVLDSQAEEKDGALGEELLKNRVKSKKVKAEKVFGKDSPAFDA
ncbi:hypothetical protein PF007_g23242 [Phytophthora fragariae]|uniref:Uncharacterized protein n=1 Tax=Phytophthora fragariae TaxID=53985 RepID=A0A6A3DT01_9STRA|nr:hypothetical protein PF009_g26805 [Phytophthora fragariae]KAE8970224.1 hypothetical protein PF011_g26502 [Phytophthora fragariae]KAE9079943.1 hypothetical protein PF007_g23242 [Phytophthora fragariae]KAE9190446.1 hypothetical protein PF004_g21904 [Phytophthora fragariae]